ncbi:MAG: ribosome maturation factor RimM [Sphaerochaetaceae bacterium]
MKDLLATAVIGSSYGTAGEVKLYPNNEDDDYLRKLQTVVVMSRNGEQKQVNIIAFRVLGKQLLVKFEGYENPESVKALAGCQILVERSDAYPLKKGQVYVADLPGCTVLYQGREVAKVLNAIDGSQSLLLEVVTPDGVSHMVPFMKQFVGTVDVGAKTIELKVDWVLT